MVPLKPEGTAPIYSQGLMDINYFQDAPLFEDDLFNVPVDWGAVFPELDSQVAGNLPFGNLKVQNDSTNPILSNCNASSAKEDAPDPVTFLNLDDPIPLHNEMPNMDSFRDDMDVEMQEQSPEYLDISSFLDFDSSEKGTVAQLPELPDVASVNGGEELQSPFNLSVTDGGDFANGFSDGPNSSSASLNDDLLSPFDEAGETNSLSGFHESKVVPDGIDVSCEPPVPVRTMNPESTQFSDIYRPSLVHLELPDTGTMMSPKSDLLSVAVQEMKLKRKIPKPSPPKHCATCDTWINNEQAYRNHRRTCHPLPKTEPCEYCGAFYSAKCNLEKHKKSVHNISKEYVCLVAECEKRFAEKNKLKKHVTTVHCGVRDYACDKAGCTKRFSQQSDLNRHRNLVHNDEKRYFCNTCEVEGSKCDFGRRSSLIQHLSRVHEMPERDARICSDEGRYINENGKLITRAYPPSKPRKAKRSRKRRNQSISFPTSPFTDEEDRFNTKPC